MDAQAVDRLDAGPLRRLEREPLQPEPGTLELRAEEVRLRRLAHLVPRPGDLLGLLPQRLEPFLEGELSPDEPEVQVRPLHLAEEGEAHALQRSLGHPELRLGHLLPEPALARPRERHVHQHLPEAGRLDADLDALEAVVLDAEDERGVGQGAGLGDTRALGQDVRPGPGVVRAVGERLGDQGRQHPVGRVRLEDRRKGDVAGGRPGELENDETEKGGHVRASAGLE